MLWQVGKIKEYNEPDPVDGFLNRVRAELQRPTDTDFHVVWSPAGLLRAAMLQAEGGLSTNVFLLFRGMYVRRRCAHAGGCSGKRPAETLVPIYS